MAATLTAATASFSDEYEDTYRPYYGTLDEVTDVTAGTVTESHTASTLTADNTAGTLEGTVGS